MDDDTVAADALVANARERLINDLRAGFPYMRQAAIEETVRRACKELSQGIARAKPQMAESKSRSGFLKLPKEIQNEIFEMALIVLPPDPLVVFRERKAKGKRTKTPITANFTFPRILHVSQGIRRKMLPMFLSRLAVVVHMKVDMERELPSAARYYSDQAPLFKGWIAGLGKEAPKYIKSFHLYFDNYQERRSLRVGVKLPLINDRIFEILGFHDMGMRRGVMEIYELEDFEGSARRPSRWQKRG